MEDNLFLGGGKKIMTSPAKFKKDKEIIAEYDMQVKGKDFFKQNMNLLYLCVCVLYSLNLQCRSSRYMFGCGREKHLQIDRNLQCFPIVQC